MRTDSCAPIAEAATKVSFQLNGKLVSVECVPAESLLNVLREDLLAYGTKNACEQGECGSCSVLLDDVLVCACLVPAFSCSGRRVTTIEGLTIDPLYHPLEREFETSGAVQCGFCTPGLIVSAIALLRANPSPTPEEVREGLAGNLCRCTGYTKIIEAIMKARPMGPAK